MSNIYVFYDKTIYTNIWTHALYKKSIMTILQTWSQGEKTVINFYLGVKFINVLSFVHNLYNMLKPGNMLLAQFLYYLKYCWHASCDAYVLGWNISTIIWLIHISSQWCHRSPITQLFLQQRVQDDNNGTTNVPYHWPFVRAIHQWLLVPLIKSQ